MLKLTSFRSEEFEIIKYFKTDLLRKLFGNAIFLSNYNQIKSLPNIFMNSSNKFIKTEYFI